jgi:hypothetical protein
MQGIVENQLNSKRAHVASKKYLKFYIIFHRNDSLIYLKAERWKLYDGWQYRLHFCGCCYITMDFATATSQNGVCITQQKVNIMTLFHKWVHDKK